MTAQKTMPSVLIVDDESGILQTLEILLRAEGFAPHVAQGGRVALERIPELSPDIVLTDVRMPEQGTHGHITLLLAGHLTRAAGPVAPAELADRVRELVAEHGTFWSKSAREPGAEPELVEKALTRLVALGLAERTERGVVPRPALARYAVGEPVVREPGRARRPAVNVQDER